MTDDPLCIGISDKIDRRSARYLSTHNFPQEKLIVWNIRSLEHELRQQYDCILGGETRYEKIELVLKHLEDRQKSLLEFLNLGGDLIVFLDYLAETHYPADFGSERIDITQDLIHRMMGTKRASGDKMEIADSCKGLGSLTNIAGDLHYEMIITHKALKPLLIVPQSKHVVGGYVKSTGGGLMIFLPQPKAHLLTDRGSFQSLDADFFKSIIELPEAIRELKIESASEFVVPDWAQKSMLPREHVALNKISELRKDTQRIEREIDFQRKIVEVQKKFKLLFAGSGEPLEDAICEVFSVLEIPVAKGPKGKCDIIALIGSVIVGIEAKGVSGRAAMSYLGQCGIWVSQIKASIRTPISQQDEETRAYTSILQDLGVQIPESDEDEQQYEVKGMVVVNAQNGLPLAERGQNNDPVFGPNILTNAERDGILCVSGIQLLNMMLAVDADVLEKQDVENLIVTEVGALSGYDQWNEYLVQLEESESE